MSEMSGPRADDLDERLDEQHLTGQWDFIRQMEENPPPALGPHHWEWETIERALYDAKAEIDVEELTPDMRRAVLLVNPGLKPTPAPGTVSRTIHFGAQIAEPGESAGLHRHNITAFRFGVRGNDDVVTVVNGERFPMNPGDLVLTPRMCWHEHENASDEDAVWLDGVDAPLVAGGLGATHFEQHAADGEGPDPRPEGDSEDRFGTLRPVGERGYRVPESFDSEVGLPNAPPHRFAWEDARDALLAAEGDEAARDPYNGVYMEYVNPATGTGPVFETMSLRLQLLREGEETASHRHNSTEVHHVRKGAGHTEIDGERYEWSQGDCFVVPPMAWHSHASTDEETVLFVTSDQPVYDGFNIHNVEER